MTSTDFAAFEGTRPVNERQRFDAGTLEAWLASNVDGFRGPLSIEQFAGGQSNPTFKLITPSRSYVMRAKPGPAEKLLPSAHAIEREFRVMDALAATDVPVARMLALCEDESVIAALHRVDVDAADLSSYGKPGNYFERQIGRWSKQYVASETEPIDAMNQLIDWLPQHIPPSQQTKVSVVHGDYRLDNLIFHPTEPRVLAVLDWERSTLGDPLADFAYHCMAWHVEPSQFRGIAGLDWAALGIPDESAYVARYCERTGSTIEGDWNFYLAYQHVPHRRDSARHHEACGRWHGRERASHRCRQTRAPNGQTRLAIRAKSRLIKIA